MNISERISDSFQYVVDGVIRRPGTWFFLTLFGFGNTLIAMGGNSLVYKLYPVLKIGTPVTFPPPLNHCALQVVILMIILGILLVILQAGYCTRIYRGITPAPSIQDWKNLFSDGIRFSLISFLYWVLPALICLWTVIIPGLNFISTTHQNQATSTPLVMSPELLHAIGIALGGIVLSGLLSIIFTIISIIGLIRFSRSRTMRSAFDLPEIVARISEIGWIRYLFSLILLAVLAFFFSGIMFLISLIFPVLGIIIGHGGLIVNQMMTGLAILLRIVFGVLMFVFSARYLAVLYDTVPVPVQEPFVSPNSSEIIFE